MAFTISAYATDVTIAATQITNPAFNPTAVAPDVTLTNVSVTSGNVNVSCASCFRRQWVGIGGFQITINGVQYVVNTVTSQSALTLTTTYAGATSSTATVLWYRYVLLRFYADRFFIPLGANYVVQPGTPGSSAFFKQVACSLINNGSDTILYLPIVILPATTDALVTNQARFFAGFYRADDSLVAPYACFTQFAIPPNTPTTWVALCNYNAPGAIVPPNSEAYTKPQIDSRLPTCTSGQLVYYQVTGNVLQCLTVGSGLTVNTSTNTITSTGGGGGGITTLNTLTAASQTFASVNDTNVTLSISSVTSTHTFTMGWTGALAVGRGGTGITSYTTGDLIYASGASTLSKLGIGTAGQCLVVSGGLPSWGACGGGGGTPGGSNTQVQYNNAGAFGGVSGFTSDGTNVTAGSGNLRTTRPRITTSIDDANGNSVFTTPATASAVNAFTVTNAATGNNPKISTSGTDSNINFDIDSKGTGIIRFLHASLSVPVTLTDAATIATDASLSNRFRVTLGGNRTLGNPSNSVDGQQIVWEVIQDGTGGRTLAFDTNFAFGAEIATCAVGNTANKRSFITAIYTNSITKWQIVGCVTNY